MKGTIPISLKLKNQRISPRDSYNLRSFDSKEEKESNNNSIIKMEYRPFCVVCIVGIRIQSNIKTRRAVHEFRTILWVKRLSKEFLLKNRKQERDFRIFMKME